MGQWQHLSTAPIPLKLSLIFPHPPPFKFPTISPSVYSSPRLLSTNINTLLSSPVRFRHVCNFNDSDMVSQLELGKSDGKKKRVTGIFWIILVNLGIFVADHWFHVLKHLSSNLFFLYIFGKLVEEEEGSFALWTSYILTGAGANLVSWLVLPRNLVSVGASGAVFGLFAISVLVKISWDWRKILEVLILGQFVIEKVTYYTTNGLR
ncbi:hypothetical protein IFM89_023042 [Coptis chinensis]|uniref:Peptidase S54 rhomboid domain-containing protein n=1 Tax=Coptis chinensis TaxID=261450 RepID=A0A835ICP6_9MAGN|nr:hypothetical protein IFM89_023042 [Coptis chinensis]